MKFDANFAHEAKIYNTYRDVNTGDQLAHALESMAWKEGIPGSESEGLVEKIMTEVEAYENTCDLVSEDAQAAMESVFEKISQQEPAQRMDIMNQMLFGFCLFTEEEELRKLRSGVSGEALYRQEFPEAIAWSPEAEDELKQQLVEKATNLRLSPAALERMRISLRNTGDYVATSAALGRDGYTLKCAAAMDLYLRNRDHITPEEAALNACAFVDLEAMADGVRVGEIAETVSLILLAVRLVVMFCRIVSLMMAAATLGELVITVVVGLLMLEGACLAGTFISHQIGKLAVVGDHLVRAGAQALGEGLQRICETAERAFHREENVNYVDAVSYNVETETAYI